MLTEGIDIPTLETAAAIPSYANPGDAGADITSAETVTIPPNQRALISTGLKCQLPENSVGFVCSRSGLSANEGVFVLNAPGIIDQGYTGEIKVILYNSATTPYTVNTGDRIAQLVLMPSVQANFLPVTQEIFDQLITERAEGGFGSSGE